MHKSNKTIKLKLFICFIICMSFAPYTFASTGLTEEQHIPQGKNNLLKLDTVLTDKILLSNEKYDLRNSIEISIKDQKTTSACWAFAANTVLETNLELRNNERYDFSERHVVYSTSKTFTDGINSLGHNKEPAGGGNELIAMAYYTSGRGPILEEEMPFDVSEQRISLSEIKNKTVQKKITDYIIFPNVLKIKDEDSNIIYTDNTKSKEYTEMEVNLIRNSIKQHIINYGAVVTMTVAGSAYYDYYNYDLDYPAFYSDNPDYVPNHQVAIIGWDDNYPVENFNEKNRPSKPGAYLVLNSYGTNNYKYGCYYISYEDCFVECGAVGVLNIEDIDYTNIYQYDPLGLSSNVCIENQEILYGANVFTKNKTSVEVLNEVSIASTVDQKIELYVNPLDGELSANKLQKVEIEQDTIRNGYTTIKLKTPIELTGEKFVIAVKYISNNQTAYIGIEVPNTAFWLTATSNEGESFYSEDGNTWADLKSENINNANICIKAFTKTIGYNIISDSYKIEEDLIYRVSPNTQLDVFKNNIQSSGNIKILRNDIELQGSDIITTSTTIQVDDYKTYKVIVCGDITGTGKITTTDISKLKLHLVGTESLDEIGRIAADMNYSGDVTLTDLSQMKSAIVGLIKL